MSLEVWMNFGNGVDGVKVCGGQDTLFMHMGSSAFHERFCFVKAYF
jgi:hypothetical protein